MSDQCSTCINRDNLEACESTECSVHDSAYVRDLYNKKVGLSQELQKANDFMDSDFKRIKALESEIKILKGGPDHKIEHSPGMNDAVARYVEEKIECQAYDIDEEINAFIKRALIVVDVQNDFCPGGALPVPDGDAVVPVINSIMEKFDYVDMSCDWHVPNHSSFVTKGGPWPVHCVQNTKGAQIHAGLKNGDRVVYKGTHIDVDSYSAFFNAPDEPTRLHGSLQTQIINDLYVCGLATDYCVKATVLDALKLGYKVWVIEDGCRAVNIKEGDGRKAFDEMQEAGVTLIMSGDVG